jgi:hypothetical protein
MENIYEVMKNLAKEFIENQEIFEEKGTKAAASRARKAAGEFKKLVPEFRRKSVEDCK